MVNHDVKDLSLATEGVKRIEWAAREMPVVRSGNIVIRRIMNVSSSFDHRVVDGADGAALIQNLKRMLETPALIFI